MSSERRHYGISKSTDIYDKIREIEDRLTMLYEMRIPHFMNPVENTKMIYGEIKEKPVSLIKEINQKPIIEF